MALSEAAVKNQMATYWSSLGARYRLHTGSPGAAANANDNVVTGGGYSDQTTTWGTASGGVITGSQVVFPVGDITATHATRWNAAGTVRLDVIDITDVDITPSGEIRLTPSYTQT